MGKKTASEKPVRYLKDGKYPNLFRNEASGRYYVRKSHTGAGTLFKSTGQTNRYQAILEMNRILKEWLRADSAAKQDPDFDTVADEVIECYQAKAEKTYEEVEGNIRLHLSKTFAGIPISQVARHWTRHKVRCKLERPDRKLKHDRKVLLLIFRHAKVQGYVEAVPDLPLDLCDRQAAKGRALTNREYHALLKRLPPNWKFKLRFLRFTGARANELRLLRWEHIDFKKGVIHVPPEISKTRHGRDYFIERGLLKELQRRRDEISPKSPYVCPNRSDPARPESATDKTFQRAKKELGIKVKRHWARYAAATDAIRGGTAPMLVQSALGMSDQVMKRVYIDVSEKDRRKMARAMRRGAEE